MKSIISETDAPKQTPFPKLMQNKYNHMVILFTRLGDGTVVWPGASEYPVGRTGVMWYGPLYEDFHGTVTLSNS